MLQKFKLPKESIIRTVQQKVFIFRAWQNRDSIDWIENINLEYVNMQINPPDELKCLK